MQLCQGFRMLHDVRGHQSFESSVSHQASGHVTGGDIFIITLSIGEVQWCRSDLSEAVASQVSTV